MKHIVHVSFCHKQKIFCFGLKGKTFCNFDPKTFEKNLESIDWNTILQLTSGKQNLQSQLFLGKVENLLDKHCPLKKISKRNLKKSKSWITPALCYSRKITNTRSNSAKQPILI